MPSRGLTINTPPPRPGLLPHRGPQAQLAPPPLYLEPPSISHHLYVCPACPAVQEPPCSQTDAKMFMRSRTGPSGSLLRTSGPNCSFSPSRRHSFHGFGRDRGGNQVGVHYRARFVSSSVRILSCELQSAAQGQASLGTSPRHGERLSPRGSTWLSLGVVPLPILSLPCLSGSGTQLAPRKGGSLSAAPLPIRQVQYVPSWVRVSLTPKALPFLGAARGS